MPDLVDKPTYESFMAKFGVVCPDDRLERVLNRLRFSGPEGGCDHCGWDLDIGTTAGKIEDTGGIITKIDIISKCQRCQTEVHIRTQIDSTGQLFGVMRSYKSPGFDYFLNKIRNWWQARLQKYNQGDNMKKLTLVLAVFIFSSNSFALDMSQIKPVTIKKSPRQQELEKKYAEIKPTMPGKTPYEVCLAALAKLPPLTVPRSHPDYSKQEASCDAYEGSSTLKAATDRRMAEKASEKRKENAAPVVKPR